ncbi:helix-turn-helix domain-containing protein [Streptomyces durmitorensis]|uniref:Helix-turn-helix domain-containing protein n=1 Tax=Streptomyces durmitorensis TaxID=319947 RepID=A0ABY4PU94_9ACTN|nr:helix-turn-helix domain-containing protein [Streptomyces durmitorensis]UQT56804.1 helix-turn-helix domain-containing protein [Streptomyces durmitorensis]
MTQSPATPLPSPKERRRLREAKSLSQADVATRVGVTRETVRSWESGRSTPRGRRRAAYAKLLAEIANERTVHDKRPVRRPSWAKDLESTVDAKDGKSPARIPVGAAMNGHVTPAQPLVRTTGADTATATAAAAAAAAVQDATEPAPARSTAGPTPAEAFDALCTTCAPGLVRQTYLLTGRRILAQESVERAFQLAWQRWPEVAVDRDPAGWVRAAAYEYAMSPWHRLRPTHRQPDAPPATAADRAFLTVLMSLPPAQRRTLLLYDGVGLDLPETAAETEASTPAAANRLLRAREAIAERLPEQAATPEALHQRLGELCSAEKLQPPNAGRVRTGSEHRARFWTRAAIAFTALIVGATALTLRSAPTHYEPPQSPGKAISGVPPRMGPGHLTYEDQILHKKLREDLSSGPEKLTPQLR